MSRRWSRPAAVLIIVATCAGCSSWSNRATQLSGDALSTDSATSTPTTEALRTDEVEEPCDDHNVASLTKSFPPSDRPTTGPTIDTIKSRGALIVGVDETTLLLSYRDPGSGDLQGFEIDLAKAIASDLLGDENKIEFKTVTPLQKTVLANHGEVDMTISAVSITCKRRKDVDFSTEYFHASQKLMVRSDSGIHDKRDLTGKQLCVTKGSTSSDLEAALPHVNFVEVPDRTDCLRALQDGTVDAILTHETFLLGFLLEDPNTEILPDSISEQHYGIAMPELHQDLVRWVNAELARLRDSGEIEALYDKHFRDCDICRPISPMLPDPFDLAARHG